MTPAALAALLSALATITAARAVLRPALRRAALALAILAAADIARLWTYGGRAPHLDVALSLLWPIAAAALIGGPWPLVVGLGYAVGLAVWGRHLAGHWTAALQLPRYAVGALATTLAIRHQVWAREAPWNASQRIGLWLAAGQVVMVGADAIERAAGVEGLWSRWGSVRILSAFFYGLCALVALAEPRPR